MNLMKTVFFLITSAFFSQTQAASFYVAQCTATVDRKVESLKLRLDQSGNIIDWDKKHLAQVVAGKMFQIFGENFDESPVENIKKYKSTNGFSIVELVTTADNIKIGIHLTTKSGFYEYRDFGSGNGNSKQILTCTIK